MGSLKYGFFPDSVDMDIFSPIIKTRLIDNFLVEIREGLKLSPSLTLFKELNETFDLATYLKVLCNSKCHWALSWLRLSSHSLVIETGRHNNIQCEDRKCIFVTLTM